MANPLAGVVTDPGYIAARLARQRANATANATLRQQRSQALIGYGDPNLAKALGLGVDPNTGAAASANQYSTLAALRLAHANAQRGILSNLAGRGILHSGELGYQQGREAHSYGQANYDAYQQLLGQLNNYLGAYTDTTQHQNDLVNQALQTAYGNYSNQVLGGLYG